ERSRPCRFGSRQSAAFLNGICLRIDNCRAAQSDSIGDARCRGWRVVPAEHALKQRGGLDELPRLRETCGFADDVLLQHGFTASCRRERPLPPDSHAKLPAPRLKQWWREQVRVS